MKLSDKEFRAMNNPVRQLLQRTIEFPLFKRMGLTGERLDILEIGCGSGYGATLLATLNPRSYVGIDVMPEQIALAQQLNLPDTAFMVRDAADLSCFDDNSKDVIVIFGVLHHIPPWREVLVECFRVLRPGGRLFLEEPGGRSIEFFDRLFHWGHPVGGFRLKGLEDFLTRIGFTIRQKRWICGFGVYHAEKTG
jgi:ubiquinone/menaquinone biosynthesis C-methylase UbiE